MEKLGKILLLAVNICINVFLIMLIIVLALWMFWGISPKESVQNTLYWIQQSWDSLWGIEVEERTLLMTQKLRKRAHQHIYVANPNQRDKNGNDIVMQPYK